MRQEMRSLEHICFRKDKRNQMKMIERKQGKGRKGFHNLRHAFPWFGWRFQNSSAGQVKQAAP